MLYLISTPIGNLKDITLRAIEVFKKVDEIICESTDTALKLLNHYQIKKPLIHLSDENQLEKTPQIIEKLKQGKKLALISDAGTPTISDPGQFLISQAIKHGIKLVPIPGPSAILSALITSGLPTQPFLFLGFLPKKPSQKEKLFKQLKEIKINKKKPTIVFFDSPNRIINTLKLINKVDNQTKVFLAREMTKIYEEFLRDLPQLIINQLQQRSKIKGEITLVIKFN